MSDHNSRIHAPMYLADIVIRPFHSYIIRLDIKSYYASIDHHILIDLLKQEFNDPKLIHMFTAFITAYILTNKGFTNSDKGIPIRSSLSSFFGAICCGLMKLDK